MYRFLKSDARTEDNVAEKLDQIEAKYSMKFPAVYRNYLLDYNDMPTYIVVLHTEDYDFEVSRIIPVIADYLTFEKVADNDREDEWVPRTFFPVAHNRGGDIYYWDSKNGKVVMLFTDDIDNPVEVSSDMEEFFERLNLGELK